MPCTRVIEKPGPPGLLLFTPGDRHGPDDTSHHNHSRPAHFWRRLVRARTLVLTALAFNRGLQHGS